MRRGIDVWITHIGGYPPKIQCQGQRGVVRKDPPKLFISGHSHILKVMWDKKLELLHMNPGACGKHGFHQVRTMLRFVIDGSEIKDSGNCGNWESDNKVKTPMLPSGFTH